MDKNILKLNNNKYHYSLYKSYHAVFITKQTVLVRSNTIQAYFNSIGYP